MAGIETAAGPGRQKADLSDVEKLGASVSRALIWQRLPRPRKTSRTPAKLVMGQLLRQPPEEGVQAPEVAFFIFMGGGTTLVEGRASACRWFGNDLNPVAWFVVKQNWRTSIWKT